MDSLARVRERRANAGARMAQMLEQEEDDFYKSTYGGFFDEDDDKEYETEGSDSDRVDSDFDCEENEHDEPIAADDDEVNTTTKRRSVAYKEKRTLEPSTSKSKPASRPIAVKARPRTGQVKATTALSALNPINSKSLRTSTQLKKEATEKRKKQAERSRRTHQRVEHREWTQAELLAEAKQTEQSNLASLARYEKLELEKARKNKSSKLKEIAGPYIRYRSLSMPIIDPTELNTKPNLTEEKIDTPNVTKNRYERTLIMFSDVELFEQYFSKQRSDAPRKPSPSICPITKLPARYFDSVTRLPYANSFAFRTLRQAYVKQLQLIEPTGRSDELNRFLNWYNLQNNRENIQTPDVIPIETDQTAVDLGQSAVDKEQQTTEVA